MSAVSVVAFGITAAVIAVASRPTSRDETPPLPHTLRVGDLDITAALNTAYGQSEPHLILLTTGRGRASVRVRFEENRSLQAGRMVYDEPLPERTIAFDQDQGCHATDLGPLPENYYAGDPEERGVSRQLVATTDGTRWVVLWTENPRIDELIEKAGLTVKFGR